MSFTPLFSQLIATLVLVFALQFVFRLFDWLLVGYSDGQSAAVECGFDQTATGSKNALTRTFAAMSILIVFELEFLIVAIALLNFELTIAFLVIIVLFSLIEICLAGK